MGKRTVTAAGDMDEPPSQRPSLEEILVVLSVEYLLEELRQRFAATRELIQQIEAKAQKPRRRSSPKRGKRK